MRARGARLENVRREPRRAAVPGAAARARRSPAAPDWREKSTALRSRTDAEARVEAPLVAFDAATPGAGRDAIAPRRRLDAHSASGDGRAPPPGRSIPPTRSRDRCNALAVRPRVHDLRMDPRPRRARSARRRARRLSGRLEATTTCRTTASRGRSPACGCAAATARHCARLDGGAVRARLEVESAAPCDHELQRRRRAARRGRRGRRDRLCITTARGRRRSRTPGIAPPLAQAAHWARVPRAGAPASAGLP